MEQVKHVSKQCRYCGKPDCKGHHVTTERAISEPPILIYDQFTKEKLPSDLRFSKLFPGQLSRWVEVRDAKTEELVLGEYMEWLTDLCEYRYNTRFRGELDFQHWKNHRVFKGFYQKLRKEVNKDLYEVRQEADIAMQGASSFGRWEWGHLDQDGDTKGIGAWTAQQWDLDNPPADIFEKYGHLAPKRYVEFREKGGACSEPHHLPCADIWCNRTNDEDERSVAHSDNSFHTANGSLSPSHPGSDSKI